MNWVRSWAISRYISEFLFIWFWWLLLIMSAGEISITLGTLTRILLLGTFGLRRFSEFAEGAFFLETCSFCCESTEISVPVSVAHLVSSLVSECCEHLIGCIFLFNLKVTKIISTCFWLIDLCSSCRIHMLQASNSILYCGKKNDFRIDSSKKRRQREWESGRYLSPKRVWQ